MRMDRVYSLNDISSTDSSQSVPGKLGTKEALLAVSVSTYVLKLLSTSSSES